MDFYEFVEECKANGLTAKEAENEYARSCEETAQAFEDNYWSNPEVAVGWAQQDLIDSYRRER